MARTLGWIAVIGLGVGVVSMSLAWTLGGRDIKRLIHDGGLGQQACADTKVTAVASERRLPRNGIDTIDVALPAPLRLNAVDGGEVVVRGEPAAIAQINLLHE